MKPQTLKIGLVALVALSLGVAAFLTFSPSPQRSSTPIAFAEFMGDVDDGKVAQVAITGQEVSAVYRADNTTFHTYAPLGYRGLADQLNAKGVSISVTR